MKLTRGRVIVFSCLGLAVAAAASLYLTQSDVTMLKVGVGGPDKFEDFRYRYIPVARDNDTDLKVTHPDLSGLTIALQSGKAVGAWVLLPASNCYAPDVRDGIPTVRCESMHGTSVLIGAKDNVREVLLGLSRTNKHAGIIGRAVGIYGSSEPIILVDDPGLQSET